MDGTVPGFEYIVAFHVRQTKGRVSHAAFFFAGPAAQICVKQVKRRSERKQTKIGHDDQAAQTAPILTLGKG